MVGTITQRQKGKAKDQRPKDTQPKGTKEGKKGYRPSPDEMKLSHPQPL